MTDKFKLGDRVIIREDSEWFGGDDDSNPIELSGEVVFVRELIGGGEPKDRFRYEVLWDNNYTNVYADFDLEIAEEIK